MNQAAKLNTNITSHKKQCQRSITSTNIIRLSEVNPKFYVLEPTKLVANALEFKKLIKKINTSQSAIMDGVIECSIVQNRMQQQQKNTDPLPIDNADDRNLDVISMFNGF